MGRCSNFICKTCKKLYYLGYMSYSSWADRGKTLEEFEDNLKKINACIATRNWHDKDGKCDPPNAGDWLPNVAYKQCIIEHKDHDFHSFSYDWVYERDNALWTDGDSYGSFQEKWIDNLDQYKDYDIDEKWPDEWPKPKETDDTD